MSCPICESPHAADVDTEGAYARARDTGAHGEGTHGWT